MQEVPSPERFGLLLISLDSSLYYSGRNDYQDSGELNEKVDGQ